MRIKWLGHSCFLLISESGVKVLTDPFDKQVGYKLPAVEADIVTTSHSHFDHDYIQIVKGNFKHINQTGVFEKAGIRVTGVSTFHDEVQGAKRGKNIIYIFDMDGLRICHCGDLGHIPSQEQALAIGQVDILLIPVGGTFTVDSAEALQVVELLKPRLTIPMHFKTSVLSFPIDGVEKFLIASGIYQNDTFANKQEINIVQKTIGALPKVLVLNFEQ